jgi:glycosyltransferase involved in cell wall biosynthesis
MNGSFGSRGGPPPSVLHVLRNLLLHPIETIARRWNWKAALLSSSVRALIFFAANLPAGPRASLGHLGSRTELARLLASVDVFVHPNPREPFGIGRLEAMASGTPLVAPEAGGVLEYADPGCAWLAKPEGKAFAAAVLEVLSNPLAVRAKVESARLVGERYNWRKVTDQFFDTYEAFHAVRTIASEHFGAATSPRIVPPHKQLVPAQSLAPTHATLQP